MGGWENGDAEMDATQSIPWFQCNAAHPCEIFLDAEVPNFAANHHPCIDGRKDVIIIYINANGCSWFLSAFVTTGHRTMSAFAKQDLGAPDVGRCKRRHCPMSGVWCLLIGNSKKCCYKPKLDLGMKNFHYHLHLNTYEAVGGQSIDGHLLSNYDKHPKGYCDV